MEGRDNALEVKVDGNLPILSAEFGKRPADARSASVGETAVQPSEVGYHRGKCGLAGGPVGHVRLITAHVSAKFTQLFDRSGILVGVSPQKSHRRAGTNQSARHRQPEAAVTAGH